MASAAKIPVIDISATGQEEQLKVAKELVDAAVEHGFVYIKNTGADIPAAAVENAFNLVRFPKDPSYEYICKYICIYT
jgi:isopenicillin N synthase-like dioxygenase